MPFAFEDPGSPLAVGPWWPIVTDKQVDAALAYVVQCDCSATSARWAVVAGQPGVRCARCLGSREGVWSRRNYGAMGADKLLTCIGELVVGIATGALEGAFAACLARGGDPREDLDRAMAHARRLGLVQPRV